MSVEPHDSRAFAVLLAGAQRSLATVERVSLEPLGLTPATFRLLDLVGREPGIAPAVAADALGVTRPSITAWIGPLADLGLLERGGVPGDGRRARLALTHDGGRVHRAAVDAVRRAHTRLLASAIDPVEQADLLDALQRIAEAGS